MSFELLKRLPLTKVDETTHEVFGVCTGEEPDHEDEICDYEAAKAEYIAWEADALARSTIPGMEPSHGNIRMQHGAEVAGKATGIEFDDANKRIYLRSVPKDDTTFSLLQRGFLTGYSQGGSYLWRKCDTCKTDVARSEGNWCAKCRGPRKMRYGCKIAEVSYVDSPCYKGATFDYVKADGTTELRKAVGNAESQKIPNEGKPVETINKAATEAAPAALDIEAIEQALAKRAEEKTLAAAEAAAKAASEQKAAEEAAAVKAALVVKHREAVIEFVKGAIAEKSTGKTLRKSLYDVQEFASLLSNLYYLTRSAADEAVWEGDDSAMPETLRQLLSHAAEAFLAMAVEETSELAANAAKGNLMKPEVQKSILLKRVEAFTAIAKSHSDLAEALKQGEAEAAVIEAEAAKATEATEAAKAAQTEADAIVIEPATEAAKSAEAEAVVVAAAAAAVQAMANKSEPSTVEKSIDLDALIEAQAEQEAQAEMAKLNDPEVKQRVAKLRAEKVAAYLAKTLQPTLVKSAGAANVTMVPRPGSEITAPAAVEGCGL